MEEKKQLNGNNDFKADYIPPRIEVLLIEMEQGIAAQSANVLPPNNGGVVQEEWQDDQDTDRTLGF